MDDFAVVVAAGSLRRADAAGDPVLRLPHRWTPGGVEVQTAFSGAHLLNLAVAGCVLNDLYREADRLGTPLNGVRVTAAGGFDTTTWRSSGITYAVELDSPAPAAAQEALLAAVDTVAEIPRAVRQGVPVARAVRPTAP